MLKILNGMQMLHLPLKLPHSAMLERMSPLRNLSSLDGDTILPCLDKDSDKDTILPFWTKAVTMRLVNCPTRLSLLFIGGFLC